MASSHLRPSGGINLKLHNRFPAIKLCAMEWGFHGNSESGIKSPSILEDPKPPDFREAIWKCRCEECGELTWVGSDGHTHKEGEDTLTHPNAASHGLAMGG